MSEDSPSPSPPVSVGLHLHARARRGPWIGVVLLAAMAAAAVLVPRSRDDKPETVRVAAVERRGVTQKVLAQGKVRARTQVDVASEIGGRVASVAVQVGDAVKTGDLLFALDDEQLRNTVEQLRVGLVGAEAMLQRARLGVQEADRGVERDRALRERGVLPDEQLKLSLSRADLARADLQQAQASIERTRLDMQRARDALRRARVTAPIGGTVVAVGVEVGQVVSAVQGLAGSDTMSSLGLGAPASGPSAPVVIADLSELLVKLDVDELDVGLVQQGQRAVVRAQGLRDVAFEGAVERVGLMGRDQAGAVLFVVEIGVQRVLLESGGTGGGTGGGAAEGLARADEKPPEPRALLRPGMSAQADIEVLHLPEALVVPVAAVLEGDGDKNADRVFVYEGDASRGVVMQRAVRLGPAEGDAIALLSGVEAGQRVVEGPYRALRALTDGAQVVIEPPANQDKRRGLSGARAP